MLIAILILSNVILAILFRMFPKYEVTNLKAIIVNYFTCFACGSLILNRLAIDSSTYTSTWFPYALFLSVCFIIFFNVNAYTIQKVGMIITSIFQKLSLVFPVIIGIGLFGEEGSMSKYVAILLAIVAIILINIKDKQDPETLATAKKYWYWPFLVLFGSGLIEVVIFYTQAKGIVTDAGLSFVSTLFFLAGCWGVLYLLVTRSFSFARQDIIGGIILGVPNFFTIYLLIKGLETWEGSVLFPINNLGVIVLTTILGVYLFREKLSRINYIGLVMAIICVLLISG